jgi:hypothetical protein
MILGSASYFYIKNIYIMIFLLSLSFHMHTQLKISFRYVMICESQWNLVAKTMNFGTLAINYSTRVDLDQHMFDKFRQD